MVVSDNADDVGHITVHITINIEWTKETLHRNTVYLKKFIILSFESGSMVEVESSASCMWCNHLSAASRVTGNGLCLPINAGWPMSRRIIFLNFLSS